MQNLPLNETFKKQVETLRKRIPVVSLWINIAGYVANAAIETFAFGMVLQNFLPGASSVFYFGLAFTASVILAGVQFVATKVEHHNPYRVHRGWDNYLLLVLFPAIAIFALYEAIGLQAMFFYAASVRLILLIGEWSRVNAELKFLQSEFLQDTEKLAASIEVEEKALALKQHLRRIGSKKYSESEFKAMLGNSTGTGRQRSTARTGQHAGNGVHP